MTSHVPAPGDVSRETEQPEQPRAVSRETPHIIAVINQKGGVGKTTTAVSLATDLAARHYKTLLIDLDPQGNAATSLGVESYAENVSTSLNLLFDEPGSPKVTPLTDHLHVFPGDVSLIQADLALLNRQDDRQTVLRRALVPLLPHYDFIILDSPPSLGLLTLNILIASKWVLVPIQCEYLALEGLTMLLNTVEGITTDHNPALSILGCLVTMTDLRTNLSQEVVANVREHLGDRVFNTMIPRTIRLSECPSHGKSIFDYDRWGAGARSYEALTREVLARLDLPERRKGA